MGVSRFDIRIHRSESDPTQCLGAGTSCQRARIVCCNWDQWNIRTRLQGYNSIVGRILNNIEGYVSEITFISNAITSANGCLPIARYIPGEAHAWGVVMPLFVPYSTYS